MAGSPLKSTVIESQAAQTSGTSTKIAKNAKDVVHSLDYISRVSRALRVVRSESTLVATNAACILPAQSRTACIQAANLINCAIEAHALVQKKP